MSSRSITNDGNEVPTRDKEGKLDVDIQEGIIEDDVLRQYLAQYYPGYKKIQAIKT